jgi:excisionase family DNA binding protein
MRAFLNASEVAKLLGTDRATVIRWINRGLVKGAYRPPGKQNWRIPLATYVEIRQQRHESHQL